MIANSFADEVAAIARACADHLLAGGGGAAVIGRLHDLAALADRQANINDTNINDSIGRCRKCGHWRADLCNVDGFAYCDEHYPEGLR